VCSKQKQVVWVTTAFPTGRSWVFYYRASPCTQAWISPWNIRLWSLRDAVPGCYQNSSCWCFPL